VHVDATGAQGLQTAGDLRDAGDAAGGERQGAARQTDQHGAPGGLCLARHQQAHVHHGDDFTAVGKDAEQVPGRARYTRQLGKADHLRRALGGHGIPAAAVEKTR
jgi:hypothetical protein